MRFQLLLWYRSGLNILYSFPLITKCIDISLNPDILHLPRATLKALKTVIKSQHFENLK